VRNWPFQSLAASTRLLVSLPQTFSKGLVNATFGETSYIELADGYFHSRVLCRFSPYFSLLLFFFLFSVSLGSTLVVIHIEPWIIIDDNSQSQLLTKEQYNITTSLIRFELPAFASSVYVDPDFQVRPPSCHLSLSLSLSLSLWWIDMHFTEGVNDWMQVLVSDAEETSNDIPVAVVVGVVVGVVVAMAIVGGDNLRLLFIQLPEWICEKKEVCLLFCQRSL
jgi:hypothetical protein